MSVITRGCERSINTISKPRKQAKSNVPFYVQKRPAGIPKPTVDKTSAEIQLLVKPDTKEKLNKVGFEPFYNHPEQTAALLRADIAKCAKIIKDAGIKAKQ